MKPSTLILLTATIMAISGLAAAITIISETTRNIPKENTTATDCRPVCIREDLNSQGWYYSCNKTLIKYSHCQNCGIACMNARNIFEGWYETCSYKPIIYADCNTTVPKTPATVLTITVTTKATTTSTTTTTTTSTTTTTRQPTTTIHATTTTLIESTILPSGTKPVCMAKTAQLKGWFNPITGQLIRRAGCSHCNAVCLTNKKTEGWYDGCNSNFLIAAECV